MPLAFLVFVAPRGGGDSLQSPPAEGHLERIAGNPETKGKPLAERLLRPPPPPAYAYAYGKTERG
jgi:hypothetical protein